MALEFWAGIALYIAPMYIANSSAMIFGGRTPLDLNRKWVDGKPIFGSGKTFKGTAIGVISGTIVAFLINAAIPEITSLLTPEYVVLGFLLSFGAVAGDIVASFFKRRNNIKQGTPVLFLDQLDFVFGAAVFAGVIYLPSLYEFLIIGIATMVVHRVSNFVAFKLRIKKVPW
ncbi:MAG: CDP-2,3-bis-(O-geranylgeranyl)-sn-glycerol synthase [Candidatus Diapherotrites archaeon]